MKNTTYLFKGLIFSALLFSLMVLLLAFLMQHLQWRDSVMLPLLVIVYCISSLCGSLYFSKHAKKRRFLWGIGFGTALFALYLAASFCLAPEAGVNTQRMLIFLASSLASGCLGGMLS